MKGRLKSSRPFVFGLGFSKSSGKELMMGGISTRNRQSEIGNQPGFQNQGRISSQGKNE
jgi:hypothetical protein